MALAAAAVLTVFVSADVLIGLASGDPAPLDATAMRFNLIAAATAAVGILINDRWLNL